MGSPLALFGPLLGFVQHGSLFGDFERALWIQ